MLVLKRQDDGSMDQDRLSSIESLLAKIKAGDVAARQQLFSLVDEQLRKLTRKMLGSFAVVRRWEETDDVWQNASMRIWNSFDKMEFQSARHFLNSSSLQIRRELLTLAEFYRRPNNAAARHQTPQKSAHGTDGASLDWENSTDNLEVISSWTRLHEEVDELPDQLREVFDLHWYQELTMDAIAKLLDVSTRTVKRRWQAARLALSDSIDFS